MPLLILVNPVSGDRSAVKYVTESVVPLLDQHKVQHDGIVQTESAGHAGSLTIDFVKKHEGDVTILLASGDGTLHEIVNLLSTAELQGSRAKAQIHFVLVPCGTANAIYSSFFPPQSPDAPTDKLQSVNAFLQGSQKLLPLTLAISTIYPRPRTANAQPKVAISVVVASTSLHASILQDSEALRAEIPGIERFKVAAEANIARWYYGSVRLLPVPSARSVQIYDPATKAFKDHPESHVDDPIVDVDGPFFYFLSTVNVDRLEPTFCITPLHSKITSPASASMDIVMVRPFRDPSNDWVDDEEARKKFAEKGVAVLTSAYKDGVHVDLRYDEDGKVGTTGDGPSVVEYVRCGGFEWVPIDDDDAKAHLLCADGAIYEIPKGGKVSSAAATPDATAGFMIVT